MEYKIQNSDTIKELRDGARLSISEGFPERLAGSVVPVMNINPKDYRICNIAKTTSAVNATSATIYTTPADKDFYLVGFSIGLIKDATATSINSGISAYIDGLNTALIGIASLTLTAQSETLSQTLAYPIKVDRNTIIAVTNTTNVGNISARGSIIGYTVEP